MTTDPPLPVERRTWVTHFYRQGEYRHQRQHEQRGGQRQDKVKNPLLTATSSSGWLRKPQHGEEVEITRLHAE